MIDQRWKNIAAAVGEAAIVFCLIAFTPIRNLIPGYPNARIRNEAIDNAIKMDSLEKVTRNWNIYMTNLSRVLRGDARVEIDSMIPDLGTARFLSRKSPEELLRQDSLLTNERYLQDKFAVGESVQRNLPIQGIHFFPPVKGLVITPFDPAINPGVDISIQTNSVICSVLQGTVIFSDRDDIDGCSVLVQHPDDLVSVYIYNEKALVNVGDKIEAGTPIAVAGGIASLNKGEYIHFELWHRGSAVDPAKYISF